ncbi:MAG: AAA family ATPase [Deltaproteobacteria bacterium]|nr:AAA family ATPase [Deltaproteobacteria bacterium]
MDLYAILDQVVELLQKRGRVTYRALKVQFTLEDEQLEALKDELLFAHPQVRDEDDRGLIWTSKQIVASAQLPVAGSPLPVSYTPLHLAERIRAEHAALAARGSADGERKTITALFADLKGSTALIEGLDPEEARRLIDPALQLMMDAVHRYEGYVAQALGDGIFALFGAPIAHEDHPQRALYAALRMQEEMRRYGGQVRLRHGAPLAMRVGVNTGEVVVRSIHKDDLHTDYVPVGHATNLAARMEQLATPGSILITEDTRKLVEGYFDLKALGAAAIKGVEAPLPVYEVIGVGPLRTRLQVAARRGLTRFVGRQSERDQLQQALAQAQTGHGQIVGVMGEPGLGKSRLFYEFKLTALSGSLALDAYSVSHGKAAPYLPVIELLKNYFQLQPQDDERTRKEKIAGKVLILDRSLEDTLPYLFSLLGIEDQQSSLQQLDPQIRRRRTFDALKRLLLRESLNQPLILTFEDLHWIDSETQGFLDILSESIASARILLLVNYRPEYRSAGQAGRHEWGSKTYYTQLRLSPLGRGESEELLTFLLGTDANLKPLKHLVLAKTDGTPFFMEEVVQTLAEEGVLTGDRGSYHCEKSPPELHISPHVQGVLAARIDRLGMAEKELLHHLAVIGREFPLSLVRQVVTQPEEELYRLLSSLQRKEFLYEQPAFPEVEYIFKHALTQEVAYTSVLQEQRKILHERTAQALEELHSSRLDDHYSDLAHHYSRSGNAQKAVHYLHLAGQQAVQRSANAEAVSHLTTAIALLQTLPDTPARLQQELSLHLALGVSVAATKTWGAPEVETVYIRARELCQAVGETPQLVTVLLGLWAVYITRPDYQSALELGKQILAVAESKQDPTLLLDAHYALGCTLFGMGDFAAALKHAEQGMGFYNPQQHRSLASQQVWVDPGIACLTFGAWSLWYLGYPDQALKKAQDAQAILRELSYPLSIAYAQLTLATTHAACREARAAREWAEALIALATEHEFAHWLGWGTMSLGWALGEQGQLEDGIARLKEGLAIFRATGSEVYTAHYRAVLAEVYEKAGHAEDGFRLVAEAKAVVDKTGERFVEAELYRLKGELTLKQSGVRSPASEVPNTQPPTPRTPAEAEAEACFLRAIEIARRQQAKSLELRAGMSLARLWQQQDQKDEAHQLLAEIYNWFTEGFDTKDLQEAKALLDELAEGG